MRYRSGHPCELIGLPRRTFLIHQYRPRQLKSLCRLAHIVYVEADIELAVMNANHFKTIRVIFRVPAFHHREIANAVDAGVFPEIDENDFASIVGDVVGNGRAFIQPRATRAEIGRRPNLRIHLLSESGQGETNDERHQRHRRLEPAPHGHLQTIKNMTPLRLFRFKANSPSEPNTIVYSGAEPRTIHTQVF